MSAASAGGGTPLCEVETVFPGQRYVTRAFLEVVPQLPTSKPPPRATSTPNNVKNANDLIRTISQNESIFEDDLEGLSLPSRAELQDQVSQHQERVRHVEQRLLLCEQSNASLSMEIDRLQASLERAKEREADRDRSLLEQERQQTDVRRERDELQESLTHAETVRAELKAQIRLLEIERTTLQRELEDAEAKVLELSDEAEIARLQQAEAERSSAVLVFKVQTLKQQDAARASKHEEALSLIKEQDCKLRDKAEEIEHARLDKEVLQDKIKGLKRQLLMVTSASSAATSGPASASSALVSMLGAVAECEDDDSDELQRVLMATYLNNNSMMSSAELAENSAPASLGDEFRALHDSGMLPIGMESLDESPADFLDKMVDERQAMTERHILKLKPRVELLASQAVLECERQNMCAQRLIETVRAEEEQLIRVLGRLLPPQAGEEPCVLVLAIKEMRAAVSSATESLSERMGGLELQLTQATPAEGEPIAPGPPATTGPSSVADVSISLQHHGDDRPNSEASWGRGGTSLHPVPVRDVSIEGSDAVSCAGSHIERDVCSHVTPERVKCQVHRELAALQTQINKSLEVLAALARSSDLLSVLKECPTRDSHRQPDTVSAASGHEDQHGKDGDLQTSGMGCTHQLAKSCPALALQLSAATQTEDTEHQQHRSTGSTGDVQKRREFGEPSPKRFRSSSFVAAIQGADKSSVIEEQEDEQDDEQLIVETELLLEEEEEDGFEFDTRRESLELDDFSCRVTEEHPGVSPPPVDQDPDPTATTITSPPLDRRPVSPQEEEDAGSPGSERPSNLHPRLRQRGSIPGSSSVIQRSVAVDLDESEEAAVAAAQAGGSTSASGSSGGKRLSVAFPSLPEEFLRQMGLHRDSGTTPETLTEQDIEHKFTRLSLAFKTDRMTLENRLGIQQRQRDDAERNVAREVSELRGKLNRIQRLCQESETLEELSEVQHQVDVLAQSTESVSRSAEMYGAVQQEERVARAVDVILAHVENLRRTQSKEHAELEEARRLLQEVAIEERPGEEVPLRGSRLRPQQLQNVQANSRRRASIAALPRSASPAEHRFASIVDASRVRPALQRVGLEATRRTSLASVFRLDGTAELPGIETAGSSRVRREASESSVGLPGEPETTLVSLVGVHEVDAATATVPGLLEAATLDELEDELSVDAADYDGTPSEDELGDDLLWRNGDVRQRRTSALTAAPTTSGALAEWISPSISFRSVVGGLWRHVRSLRWPWTTEQSVLMLRRGATAVLLVLAALTMLLVLVPASAVAHGGRVLCWSPLRIQVAQNFDPGFGFEFKRQEPPPT